MFTVFTIDSVPNTIYFVNTDYFEQVLSNKGVDIANVNFQELRLETLVRLKDNEYRVFLLCLK